MEEVNSQWLPHQALTQGFLCRLYSIKLNTFYVLYDFKKCFFYSFSYKEKIGEGGREEEGLRRG